MLLFHVLVVTDAVLVVRRACATVLLKGVYMFTHEYIFFVCERERLCMCVCVCQ